MPQTFRNTTNMRSPTVRSPTMKSDPTMGPQPKTGLKILYEPHGREATVDVIAIHGIGANADQTWSSHGVNWLEHEEMLPSAIPDARIMRFAYESQWLGQDTIAQHPSAIASAFLSATRAKRQECQARPLVLVCHCFGGIVLQRAIITAKIHSEDWLVPQSRAQEPRDIVDCIAGILFFGTPFRGSKAQTYAKMIATIMSHFDRGNAKIYDLTDAKSQEQRDQLNNFVRIVNRQAIPICCFYEQHKSELTRIIRSGPFKKEMVVVEEDSATIDGLSSLPLAANHFNMHKYAGPEDPNYKTVLPELRRMVEEAQVRVAARLDRKPRFDDAKEIVSKPKIESLKTLRVGNPVDEKLAFQKQIDEDSQETKQWIFSNGVYTRWKNADGESLLWIFGEDGLGKTPLTISLIDDLTNRVERSSQRRALAYCFCQSHTGQTKDANAVIRSILYQILLQQSDQQHEAFEPWLKAYRSQGDNILSPRRLLDLWQILQLTLAAAGYAVAYILLYRPEECGSSILEDFPSLIAGSSSTKCRIKWIVVSRMDPAIYDAIKTPRKINLASAPSDITENPVLTPLSDKNTTPEPLSSGSILSAQKSTPPTPALDLEPALDTTLRASVSCRSTETPWECSIEVTRRPVLGKVEIVARRVGRTGILQVEAPLDIVPHTEVGSEGDRDFTVTFLSDVEISLQNDEKEWLLHDCPDYLFQDETGFRTFQEKIFGSKLVFHRSVLAIFFNGEQQSSDQDVRLWSTDEMGGEIVLMFYTNSRHGNPKEYVQVAASRFTAIGSETVAQRGKTLRLNYRELRTPHPGTSTPSNSKSRLAKLFGRSPSQEENKDHLNISFVKTQDRTAFLRFWPRT